MERIVPDTSVIIRALLSHMTAKEEIKPEEIIIHEASLAELEHQANEGKAIGFLGLDEIKKLRELSKEKNFTLSFKGHRPRAAEIRHASLGEIDALIRQLAHDEDATLVTSDKVQSEVAFAKGIKCQYFQVPETQIKKLKLEKFFDETTMSVHLRENVPPYAKRGKPGEWEFRELRKKLLSQEEIQEISKEIIEEAKIRRDGFIEIERFGSTIIQLGNFRIVITRPPFSDGHEITAVRPVKKLSLEDYEMSEKLKERIGKQAEGILVAGSPGMGKSTFAQALAENYAKQDKIVKTVEAPRDLVLPESITQYAISHGDAQEIHDILLLTRPDHTIFDEMRNTKDFQLFADLRLAGVGMVGVVHATNPIDAIQRFLGRVEMGVIPQIIDTVIFIKNGKIEKTLSVKMTVKVPAGMTEADLSRPVVVVDDFETGKAAYEIYSYGEQTVVVPVQESSRKSGALKHAEKGIKDFFRQYVDSIEVEVLNDNKCIVYVPENEIAGIIGKQGKNIERIEKELGMGVDVRELKHGHKENKFNEKTENRKENSFNEKEHGNEIIGNEIKYSLHMKGNAMHFDLGMENQNREFDVYIGENYLLTVQAGKTGVIKIKKKNNIGQAVMKAMNSGEEIRILE